MSERPRYRRDLSIPFRPTWWLPVVVVGALTGAWYAVAGAAAMRHALPWLLAALGLSWLCGVIALLVFAPYRAMPRATRLRRAVEFSLFWSRLSAAGTQDLSGIAEHVNFHLRHAVAAAPNASLKARFGMLATEASQAGPDFARIAAELSEILGQLAGDKPVGVEREFVPAPMEFAWTMGFFAACAALAVRLGSFPRTSVAWADLAVSLTAVAVAYPLAKLLLLAHYKVGISRLHTSRIVFVTDQPDSVMTVPALMHFSRRAQLVAIFIGGSREIAIPLNGAEVFFGDHDLARHACDAFVPACDRLVVNCGDALFTAGLLAQAKARGAVCQALSADGATPDGYEWLDPVLLRSHGQPAAVRINTGAQFAAGLSLTLTRRAPLWAEARPWRWLGLSVILLALDGAALAAAVTLATAACEWGIKILEPRRRAHLGRETVRVPRNPAWSARLNPEKLERRLRIASWSITLLACGIFVAIHYGTLQEADRLTIGVVALLLWPLLFAAEGLVTASLLGIKWFLDRDFRIVVFRRNTTAFGYAHKAMVLAVCGRYGQVVSLLDYSLQATTSGNGEWREEHLGTWFRVFSEVWMPAVPDVFLRDWRLQVVSELAASDAAVFDWAEEVTDHMRWELRVAMQLLPANRILVVHGSALAADDKHFLAARSTDRHPQIAVAMLHRERDDEYLWPSNNAFAAGFEDSLHRLLRDLSHEPRPLATLVATHTSAAVLRALECSKAEAEAPGEPMTDASATPEPKPDP